MRRLKNFLKNNKITNRLYGILRDAKNRMFEPIYDMQAISNFKMENRIQRTNEKIRVIFLMQFPSVWNKFSRIYERMKADDAFEPILICVPDGLVEGYKANPEDLSNETYDYFVSIGYDEAINALIGKDEWLDLEGFQSQYLFYSRPYNGYMPLPYRSKVVSKYTKICSILYAVNVVSEVRNVLLNRDFYRNVYCYFADTRGAMEQNIKNFRLAHRLGLQKTLQCGIPVLEEMVKTRGEKNHAWDFSENNFRVVWTPRWTTDLALGGSNFFTYYLWFLDYAKKRNDIDFLLRPHPLTFSNFVQKGLLREEDIAQYKAEIEKTSNVSLDREKEYIYTLWNSDVLVSDMSSVVAEYFVTGKPLIFCMSNMILEPEEEMKKLLEGCYVVYNAEELEHCLERLASGQDDLKERRRELIEEVFGDTLYTATENIVEELRTR